MEIMAGISLSPKKAMQLALQEAEKGVGWVEPNPPVGCVILDSDYNFLSSGYHKKYGGDHAEVCALKKIQDKKKLHGAHVFVTLEPCHHTGNTPPCSQKLAKYPIRSLTYGAEDPFTGKKGLDYLREKGVDIIRSFDFSREMERLVAPFKFVMLHKKSFVSLKVASSLDGVIALKNRKSQWITGKEAREHVHFLRAAHSAVLIGVNTLLQDNPRLNIRVDPFKEKKNTVVILDPQGKSFSFLPGSRLLKVHSPDEVILCCSDQVKQDISALKVTVKTYPDFFFKEWVFTQNNLRHKKTEEKKLVEVKNSRKKDLNKRKINKSDPIKEQAKKCFLLPSLLKDLYQQEQISSVLVEGGAFCWSQFLEQQTAQRLYLYMAPRIMGPGLYWSGDFTANEIHNLKTSLKSVNFKSIGEDFLIEGFFD